MHSHESDADIDDEYHAYLWGQESPRAFARRRKFSSARKAAGTSPLLVRVDVAPFDPADVVPR